MYFDKDLLELMVQRVCAMHAGQTRKDLPIPYVFHLFDVAETVVHWGVEDAGIIAAAVGHDLIEDTPDNESGLVKAFGERVASFIQELTWIKEEGTTRRMKVDYWRKFVERSTPEAFLIKMADRICNVRDYLRQRVRENEYQGEYAARYACMMYPVWRAYDRRRSNELKGLVTTSGLGLMDLEVSWLTSLINSDRKLGISIWRSSDEEIDEALGAETIYIEGE